MEWINSDVPGDESPHCSFCDKQIGIACDAIAMRAGSIKNMGRLYGFSAELFEDRRDVRWFHFSCLELVFDFSAAEGHDDPTDCAFCPGDLLGEPECYELEFGYFALQGADTWWEAVKDLKDNPTQICVCTECIEGSIGEGDNAEMRRRLGKVSHPDKQINGLRSDMEMVVRPHLKKRGRRPPSARR